MDVNNIKAYTLSASLSATELFEALDNTNINEYKWDSQKQSRYIETVLTHSIMGTIVIRRHQDGSLTVVDGKERINAVRSFINGNLKITNPIFFKELDNKAAGDMPPRVKRQVKSNFGHINVEEILSTVSDDDAEKFAQMLYF